MARQRKLTPERKAFINSLLEHYQPSDANDVQEMLKDLLGDTLQGMLEAEMDQKLGYSKYDYQNKETDDSRNGYSKKTVTSSMGPIELDKIIQSKNRVLNDNKIIIPIVSHGDPIGSITVLPKAGHALGDTELKVAEVGATFLGRQMES